MTLDPIFFLNFFSHLILYYILENFNSSSLLIKLFQFFNFLVLSVKKSISEILVVEFMSLQVQRPSRTAYFRIYSVDGTLFYNKDVSSYFDYKILPNNTVQLKLDGNVNFLEKNSYYVILGPGFAKRSESCGVESQAVIDSSYWKLTISKIR